MSCSRSHSLFTLSVGTFGNSGDPVCKQITAVSITVNAVSGSTLVGLTFLVLSSPSSLHLASRIALRSECRIGLRPHSTGNIRYKVPSCGTFPISKLTA